MMRASGQQASSSRFAVQRDVPCALIKMIAERDREQAMTDIIGDTGTRLPADRKIRR